MEVVIKTVSLPLFMTYFYHFCGNLYYILYANFIFIYKSLIFKDLYRIKINKASTSIDLQKRICQKCHLF